MNHTVLHKVLEDLIPSNRFLMDDTYVKSLETSRNQLTEAVPFLLGNASNLLKQFKITYPVPIFEEEWGIDVKMPFKSCWFEFEINSTRIEPGQIPTSRRGVSAYSIDKDSFVLRSICYFEKYKAWLASPITFFVSPGIPLHQTKIGEYLFNRYSDVNPVAFTRSTLPLPVATTKTFTLEQFDKIIKEDIEDFFIVNLALMLINSRNTVIIKEDAPAKLNKARIKKNRIPIPSHRIIKVKIPKTVVVNGKKQTSLEKYSLEEIKLRRGHFKTYTEEAPLFGKYVGRFWWNPINKENKTYKLE